MFKAVILALAAVAVAVPTAKKGDSCGANSVVKCCNSQTADKLFNKGGLLSNLDLKNLLGNCNDVTVPVVGAAVPVKSQCSNQAVCCGETHQNGLVNVACVPVNV
ncbi:fungal hydrophobin domain-containing protein [Pochonia chlamydosporia 170]|uniref:Hydrophobin n=1 Tax=Pochonia chlamydosporia 170 TaxID=1380566 RepID=A0A179FJS1_METCM|nr:fungal hydrophobin domain-containing protein [Pochonia chlamydosporia 170]OAQ65283.1 fungal hydrophobin domain-containing protein [Pochonia chlamydosporia 170]